MEPMVARETNYLVAWPGSEAMAAQSQDYKYLAAVEKANDNKQKIKLIAN